MGPLDRNRSRAVTEGDSAVSEQRALLAELQTAFVAGSEVVKQHARLRDPTTKENRGAPTPALPGSAGTGNPAWTADPCGHTSGKKLAHPATKKYASFVRVDNENELLDSKEVDVLRPVAPCSKKRLSWCLETYFRQKASMTRRLLRPASSMRAPNIRIYGEARLSWLLA